MKTLILLIPFLLFACSSPSEPDKFVNDPVGIENPPPEGGTLEGQYIDEFSHFISSQGYYDKPYNVWCDTDIRVDGDRVWFKANGNAQQIVFSGVIESDRLVGFRQYSLWTPSQGVVRLGETLPYQYTKVKQ